MATASSMTITVLVWRRYAQIPAAAQPDDNVRFPLAPTPGAGHAQVMELDAEACYRAVQSRDTRFDGQFFTAVHTTGIYCRPSCPAITPKRQNVSFHPTAASAQAAGYRACRRCLPDAAPGSPLWNIKSDLAVRAMRLIGDGLVERDGVDGLSRALGYSSRQLNRVLLAELGASPLALARANRATTARVLIQRTDLPMSDIAFAAGFSSIRQFNDTIAAVFATTPSKLRTELPRKECPAPEPIPGAVSLKLPLRQPHNIAWSTWLLEHHCARGVEDFSDGRYTRALRMPHGPVIATLMVSADQVRADLQLTDMRDLAPAVSTPAPPAGSGRRSVGCRRSPPVTPRPCPTGDRGSGDQGSRDRRRCRAIVAHHDRPANLRGGGQYGDGLAGGGPWRGSYRRHGTSNPSFSDRRNRCCRSPGGHGRASGADRSDRRGRRQTRNRQVGVASWHDWHRSTSAVVGYQGDWSMDRRLRGHAPTGRPRRAAGTRSCAAARSRRSRCRHGNRAC